MVKFYMKQRSYSHYKEDVRMIFTPVLSYLVGVPTLFWYGREGDYNLLVKNSLGENLQDLHIFCKLKFSLKTVLMLAD